MATVNINNYNMFNGRLFGRVGVNDCGYRKGRFMSTKIQSQTGRSYFDELGVEYKLGSESNSPIWQMISLRIVEISTSISNVDPRFSLVEMLNSDFNIEVDAEQGVSSTKNFSNLIETKFTWLLGGVKFNFTMTRTKNTGRYSLDCDR